MSAKRLYSLRSTVKSVKLKPMPSPTSAGPSRLRGTIPEAFRAQRRKDAESQTDYLMAEFETAKSRIEKLTAQRDCLIEKIRLLEEELEEFKSRLRSPAKCLISRGAGSSPLKPRLTRQSVRESNSTQKRVKLFSDSQGRGLSSLLWESMPHSISVEALVKPGAGSEEVVKAALSGNEVPDYIVIMAGTNDLDSQKPLALIDGILSLLHANQRSHILVIGVPPRYDVHMRSQLNAHVETINQTLLSLVDSYQNFTFIRPPPTRAHFTRHGLHLNKRGKEFICMRLSSIIRRLCNSSAMEDGSISMNGFITIDFTTGSHSSSTPLALDGRRITGQNDGSVAALGSPANYPKSLDGPFLDLQKRRKGA